MEEENTEIKTYEGMIDYWKTRAETNKTSYHIWRAIACTSLGTLAYVISFILGCLLLTKI